MSQAWINEVIQTVARYEELKNLISDAEAKQKEVIEFFQALLNFVPEADKHLQPIADSSKRIMKTVLSAHPYKSPYEAMEEAVKNLLLKQALHDAGPQHSDLELMEKILKVRSKEASDAAL